MSMTFDDDAATGTAPVGAENEAAASLASAEQLDTFRLTMTERGADDENAEKEIGDCRLLKVSACRRGIEMVFDAEYVKKQLDEAFRDLNRQIRLNGFRPGKVPRSVLAQRFGKEVGQDVIKNMAEWGIKKALEHFTLDTIGLPGILPDGDRLPEYGKPFQLRFMVEIRPQFAVSNYKGLKITRPKADLPAGEVDKIFEAMRRDKATSEVVERGAAKGDELIVAYRLPEDGELIAENEDYKMDADAPMLLKLPILEGNLLGAKIGDVRRLKVQLPEGMQSAGGSTPWAKATVKEVRALTLPELDDAFAADYAKNSMAELRESMTAELQGRREAQVKKILRAQVHALVTQGYDFEMPEKIVKDHFLDTRRAMLNDLVQQGMPAQEAQKHLNNYSQEQFDSFREQFRRIFVLDAVGKAERIFATEDDFEAYAAEQAKAHHTEPDIIKAHWEKNEGEQAHRIREQLRLDKITDFLVQHASVTEAPAEALAELAKRFSESASPLED